MLKYLCRLYSVVYAQYEEFVSPPIMRGSVQDCKGSWHCLVRRWGRWRKGSITSHEQPTSSASYLSLYRTHRRTSDLWHHFYNTFQLHLLVSSPLFLHRSFSTSSFLHNRKQSRWVEILMALPQEVKKIIFFEPKVVRQTYVYNWEDITWHDVPQPREIICTQVNLVK